VIFFWISLLDDHPVFFECSCPSVASDQDEKVGRKGTLTEAK